MSMDDITVLQETQINVTALENHVGLASAKLWQQRRIHRVPPQLKLGHTTTASYGRDSRNHGVYDPVVISIGPYHHGQPQFRATEEFKAQMLLEFMEESVKEDATKDRDFFYKEMLENINAIKGKYEGVEEHENEALAEIILRDACFLIGYMKEYDRIMIKFQEHFGTAIAILIFQDVYKLENQIPFWALKRVLDLRFGKAGGDSLMLEYVSSRSGLRNSPVKALPWKDEVENEPLHLLEVVRAALLKQDAAGNALDKPIAEIKVDSNNSRITLKKSNFPFRSASYLQAKGINFRPGSRFVRDVTFTSRSCYRILQLPILYVNYNTKVFYSNIITFEMSQRGQVDFTVTSYINFMKSLLEKAKDVKVLQESGILYSNQGSHEDILKTIKEINTHRYIHDYGAYEDVRRSIEEHCNSKAKTWMSEFIHNNLRSPCTVIALFAATFILCFTFLQTCFTIRPPN